MDTLFDSPCRYMSDSELLYEISNNRQIVSDIERSNEVIDLEKLFSSLTPGRRRVAVAAVEIYKRQQSQQVERREIFGSADIYKLMGPLIGDLPNEEFLGHISQSICQAHQESTHIGRRHNPDFSGYKADYASVD